MSVGLRRNRILILLGLAAAILIPSAGWANGPGWVGRPLAEALEELRDRGLPIVYSSSVVDPTMRVLEEPRSRRPRRILDELLAPHDLVVASGRAGRILVVPSDGPSAEARLGTISGRVEDDGGRPLPDVVLSIVGSEWRTTSASDGRFTFAGVPEGEHTVRAARGAVSVEHEVVLAPGGSAELLFQLPELELSAEEVVVVSSMSLYDDSPVAAAAMSEDEIEAVPHFADDLYRAVRVLPGVTANDVEASFQVRGGLTREVLVRLDGMELYEPYHLKDFNGILSIVDPTIVGEVTLLPSAFPAEYGDRSSSVLDMRSSLPEVLTSQIGLSMATAWAGSSGTFGGGRGAWLASARRGWVDLVLDVAGETDEGEETPSVDYWDLFGKLEYDTNPSNRISLHLLSADDGVSFDELDFDDEVHVDTDWENRYFWLRHVGLISPEAVAETALSIGTLGRDRFGFAIDRAHRAPDDRVEISDRRDVESFGVRQDWSLLPGERHSVKAGAELRTFDVRFDYHDDIERRYPIDDPRFEPSDDVTDFVDRFEGETYALWAADRWQLADRVVAELGLRWDRQTLTDDDQLSPRLNLLVDLGRRGRLRAGWGHFFQSQRPQELEVEFGETVLQPAQRAEHLTLGWEGRVGRVGTLRVEAYREEVQDPQRRYEVLFDHAAPLPQIAIDLVELAPEEATSRGVELLLRGRTDGRDDWWLGYVWSKTEELVDGRWQRRWHDQPHALNLGWIRRFGRRWTLATTWRYHTGWPTTAISARATIEGGATTEVDYDIGPFYDERWSEYHSLDLRVSRQTPLGRGLLTLFLDVQNLYDRRNVRGIDVSERTFTGRPDGVIDVEFDELSWLGLLPSFGVSWEF